MRQAKKFLLMAIVAALISPQVIAQERIAVIPDEDFQRLFSTFKAQPGESPWRDIAWLTDVAEARLRAVAEDKPLLIFTAADGNPLCRA